jgi:hypothetical protein
MRNLQSQQNRRIKSLPRGSQVEAKPFHFGRNFKITHKGKEDSTLNTHLPTIQTRSEKILVLSFALTPRSQGVA